MKTANVEGNEVMAKSLRAIRVVSGRRRLAISACLGATFSLLAFAGGSPAAEAEATAPPPNAKVMTSGELYMLYRDKSWRWSDGAGLMQSDGRRFTAWAGSGDKATWAEGRWTVNDNGRMCFKARWHSSAGTAPAKTCFSHKRVGDTIYQKREPSQDWYVFKHSTVAEGDEFNKLVSRDLVSLNLYRIRIATKPATPRPGATISRRKKK